MPISQKFPAVRPTLLLDFAKSKVLDPRITFTRSTTATYTNSSGLITSAAVNTPRFDHDPITGKSLGLRTEEQRTNLLTYSEDISNYHYIENASILTNTITAPDNTVTADTVTSSVTGGSNTCLVQKFAAVAVNTQIYIFSVFLKAGTSPTTTINMQLAGGTYQQSVATITWASNTITSSSGGTTYLSAYPNGWYRLSITLTNNGTNNAAYPRVYVKDQGTANVSGQTVYVWGWQLEAGAFPTSYIPTVASQITRSADTVTMTGANFSNWYRQDEGTFVAESTKVNQTTSSFPRIVQVDDGTDSNKITLLWWTQGNQLYSAVTTLGVSQADLGLNGFTQTASNTISQGYKVNDLTVSINGSAVITDTLITIPTVTTLRIGASNFGVESSMCIERFFYYSTRLPNTNLQTLTV